MFHLYLFVIRSRSTIGAGVYTLVGSVDREQIGPALTILFLIAGIAAALSAFCYAELACRYLHVGTLLWGVPIITLTFA